jgi:SpoVK/Ycf46/Vps4 family AAA+-type ATPase
MYDLKIDAESQSVHYRLSASQISRAVTLMLGKPDKNEDLFGWTRVCFEVLNRNRAPQFGEIIYPQIKLKDLELEDRNWELINQCISYAKYSHLAYEDEKLSHIYAYGRALTVMLNGESGTGKTMTAHAIANELGMALYHVDLSQIADKYVGETEKHLERIFEYAECMPMVLFFDEADAILGKRTDISDGHDRYNNMNVSYILQRIEQFEGIIIFATNFKSNIDSAFMRRIKYIIKYGMPNADMRKCIWESCLPDEKDLLESELKEISERFDLSGGDIKNIVIIACIMAKSSSEILGTKHIRQAIVSEYRKKGVILNDLEP